MQMFGIDAFDEAGSLETLEVKLTPKQIDWLEREADERNLSLDHVLRSIVTAQIREEALQPARDSRSGEKASSTAGTRSPNTEPTDREDESRDAPSIVESLRLASERLEELTDPDEAADTSAPSSRLSHLQSELHPPSPSEDAPETDENDDLPLDGERRSMFDLMDE